MPRLLWETHRFDGTLDFPFTVMLWSPLAFRLVGKTLSTSFIRKEWAFASLYTMPFYGRTPEIRGGTEELRLLQDGAAASVEFTQHA